MANAGGVAGVAEQARQNRLADNSSDRNHPKLTVPSSALQRAMKGEVRLSELVSEMDGYRALW